MDSEKVGLMRSRDRAGIRFMTLAGLALVALSVTPLAARTSQGSQAVATPDTKSDVPRLSMADFKTMFAAGNVLVIDVRDAGSFKAGHIPGAVNVWADEFAKHVAELKAKASGRAVVLYCSCPSEHSSAVAGRLLIDRGVPNVSALIGGYPGWIEAGGKVQR
jgi:rhodanese-related sulfurtransferase